MVRSPLSSARALPERGRPLSAATLDVTAMTLPIDAAFLKERLAAFPGVQLAAGVLPARSQRRRLWIEFWRVREAFVRLGGIDQHRFYESVGRWWGGATGFLTGASFGAVMGAAMGFPVGAALGGGAARATSEALAGSLGTYHEVLVGVPGVVLNSAPDRPCLLVLRMYTDSPLSCWGERTLQYGFGKRLARITRRGDNWELRSPDDDRLLLRACWERGDSIAHFDRIAADRAASNGLGSVLEQPLLGHLGDGRYAISALERPAFRDDISGRSLSGQLAISRLLEPDLPCGSHRIFPWTARRRWGAFCADGVPSSLTYPEAAS